MAETALEEQLEAEAAAPHEPPERTGEVVLFHSRAHNLILTHYQEIKDTTSGGIQRGVSPGFRYQFEDHKLEVDDALRKAKTEFLKRHGMHYFAFPEDLEAAIAEPVEDWLRAHSGHQGQGVDSFREVQPIVPTAEGELAAILQAQIDGDEDALRAIYETEIAGHKRPNVIKGAQSALEAIYRERAKETVEGPAE